MHEKIIKKERLLMAAQSELEHKKICSSENEKLWEKYYQQLNTRTSE